MLILVTGGASSGKSAWAEELAVRRGKTRVYLATMQIWDEEDRRRVERHRAMRRDKGFFTLERAMELEQLTEDDLSAGGAALTGECRGKMPKNGPDVILLECLSHLTANEFYRREDGAAERVLDGIRRLRGMCRDLICVTDEIGWDGEDYSGETMRYMKLLGEVNTSLAAEADMVVEIVCGIPSVLKGGAEQC